VAAAVVKLWFSNDPKETALPDLIQHSLTEIAMVGANQIFEKLREFSRELARGLAAAATALEVSEPPAEAELTSVVREMPRFDLGAVEVELRKDLFAVFGRSLTERRVRSKLKAQIGPAVDEAFQRYGRTLEVWIRRAMGELQRRFDSHADAYRAQLERLTATKETGVEEVEAVRRDLAAISQPKVAEPAR
jgi:hypothetical protein